MSNPTEDPTVHLGFQQLRQMIGEPLLVPSSLYTGSACSSRLSRLDRMFSDIKYRGEADDEEEDEDDGPMLPTSVHRKKKLTSKV